MESAVIDDARAAARAVQGDAEAFGWLVERHQAVAFRTAYLIVRNAQAAEDVAQEAFIRAYRQIHTFRESEPFRPWLLRIVTNLALNDVRARGRRFSLLERFRVLRPADVERPESVAEAASESETVLRAINELPPADRVVLYLRYFIELSEREIATTIGRPPGTVKSRLHRASARLRDVIEQQYPWLKEPADA